MDHVQAYCLRRQGRDQKLYERVGNSNWSHSSNPQFYDFRDVLKKKGLDMACEDITNNGNIARLEAVGGNSSHLLPEHAHCMINYLTNFMNNSEKNNHQKDPNYVLAKTNNSGYADYLDAAMTKVRLCLAFAGGNRARQDAEKAMIEDFKIANERFVWIVKNLVRKATRFKEGHVIRESPLLIIDAGVFIGFIKCVLLCLKGRSEKGECGYDGKGVFSYNFC